MSDGWSVVNTAEVPDPSGDFPGEMRMLGPAADAEQISFTYRRLAPGSHSFPRPGHGHRHRTQEEVYFVLTGRVRFKLDDEEVTVGPLTAVRVAPPVTRELFNDGDSDAEYVIVSTRAEDLRSEAEIVPEFWS